MATTDPMKNERKWGSWLSVLIAFSLVSLISACILSEKDEPESTYGWSWESGSDSVGQSGVYGTKGTASLSNIPGARGYHHVWLDPSGTLWLFGGHGFDSTGTSDELNDMWKYNSATLEWTWVSGSNLAGATGSYGVRGTASPTNVPGARDSCGSWRDLSGRLWVFGGFGYDSTGTDDSTLNDLWMFDPAATEWTWVSGSLTAGQAGVYGTKGTAAPSNVPGARYRPVSWLGSDGKLWLFGGFGEDAVGQIGDLNDLWQFDPTTLEWTWVSGSEVRAQPGIYGTKGTAAPANVPGARDASAAWQDATGKFWLFGGEGHDAADIFGQLNDLWMYDPATGQWTWVSGNNIVDQLGVYGTKDTASSSNIPGGNHGATTWRDSAGKFWLFGGTGYSSSGSVGMLNDLWKYDPATLAWTWVSGNSEVNRRGSYGPKGKRYLSNTPGGRDHAVSWINSAGELWLFGGDGYDSDGARNYINDMWQYIR